MAGCRYFRDCFSCLFPDCVIDNPLSVYSGISRSDLVADDKFIDSFVVLALLVVLLVSLLVHLSLLILII